MTIESEDQKLIAEQQVAEQVKHIEHQLSLKGNAQRTALHMAAILNQPEALEHFLQNGHQSEINQIDAKGCTPLHYAANENYTKSIILLLNHSANPNFSIAGYHNPMDGLYFHRDQESTPLHLLLKKDAFNQEAIQALLKAGADPFAKPRQEKCFEFYKYDIKKSPAEIAVAGIHRNAFIEVLLSKNSYANAEKQEIAKNNLAKLAIETNDTDLLTYLEKNHQLDLSAFDLLEKAVQNGSSTMVNRILPKQDKLSGHRALNGAIIAGDVNLVKNLLDAEANVDLKNKKAGHLLLAAQYATNQNKQIFISLLEAGADPDMENSGGHEIFCALWDNDKLNGIEWRDLMNHFYYHLGLKQLKAYELKLMPRLDDDYGTKFKLFGREIKCGFPAGDKKAAVKALNAVLQGEEGTASLETHLPALNNSELGGIYRKIKPLLPNKPCLERNSNLKNSIC